MNNSGSEDINGSGERERERDRDIERERVINNLSKNAK
jgi:hypothetical protein